MRKYMIRWSIAMCFMDVSTAALALAQTPGENEQAALQQAQTVHEQAVKLARGGKYADAMPLAKQALEARERLLGPEHPDLASTLNLLANLHADHGEYDHAEPLYRRSLAIRKKALGQDHLAVADSLHNLALLHKAQGHHDQAESLYLQSLAIKEKALGNNHTAVAHALHSLAVVHREQGQYDQAETLYRRALAIFENTLGKEHRNVAAFSLMSLAHLHVERGEYGKAEPLYQRALAIFEKARGKDHSDVAWCLDSLASLHSVQEAYDKAEPLYRRSLAILEKTLGNDHPGVSSALNNLALLHMGRGQYDKAEPLFRRSLAIKNKAYGRDHLYMADSLDNLAALHLAQGQYERAGKLFRRALAMRKKVLGKNHPDVASSLHNLAILYSATREKDTALRFHEQALHAWGHNLRLELRSGSEDQKHKRLAKLDNTAVPLSFHFQLAPRSARAATLAMNAILMHKGRVVDAMADTMHAARERLDAPSRAKLDRLQRLQSELAYLFHKGPGTGEPELERYRRRRVILERDIDALSAEIVRQNPAYRALDQDVRVADIQAVLPQDSALIELAIYRPFAFHAPGVPYSDRSGEPRYAAYVVHRDGPVRGVDLGPIARIDAAARAFQQSIAGHRDGLERQARALDMLIMEPVRPFLGNAQKLYIAPDSQLSMVSFAALMNEQDQYLIQRYSLTYLASGRDLVQTLPSTAPPNAALIVADPRFDLAHSLMATTSAAIMSSSDATVRSSSDPCQPISPLPGTRAEASALRSLLDDVVLWTQEQATESAMYTVHGPRILHIATHAFFLPDQEISADTEAMARFSADAQPRVAVENGLLRSGLYLAGASRCRGSQDPSEAGDDGVLTALEASSLDLRGTRLVVLSACETGMGEVKIGQGIYGMRRAFAVAGAETLVMSLWRVSDAATEHLMRHYYDNLRRGHGRSEAMRAVQLDLIAQGGQRAHPFYWASFIVSGDDSTLDGQPPPRLPAQPRGAGCAGCASSDAGELGNDAGGWLLGLIAVLWLLAGQTRRRTRSSASMPQPRTDV